MTRHSTKCESLVPIGKTTNFEEEKTNITDDKNKSIAVRWNALRNAQTQTQLIALCLTCRREIRFGTESGPQNDSKINSNTEKCFRNGANFSSHRL